MQSMRDMEVWVNEDIVVNDGNRGRRRPGPFGSANRGIMPKDTDRLRRFREKLRYNRSLYHDPRTAARAADPRHGPQ